VGAVFIQSTYLFVILTTERRKDLKTTAKRATERRIIPARKKNTAERLGKSIIYIYLATYLVSFTAQKKKHEYYTDDFRDEKDSFIHRHFNVLPIICKLTGVG
jgi:hypothetical protein